MKVHTLIFFMLILLISCDTQRISEQNIDFEERNWPMDSVIGFNFSIEDTTETYQLFLNLRNSSDYPYQNIYIGYTLTDSLDHVLISNTEDLRDLDNFTLFNPKSGEPNGKGLGDIFEHRFILIDSLKFNEPGEKKLLLEQFMRDNDLKGIVSVGYRLEIPKKE